jgi:ankyrin repeat protein
MAESLPPRPSVEHLRKQAKRLARRDQLTLGKAQHQIAQHYGAINWAALLSRVKAALSLNDPSTPDAFVRAGVVLIDADHRSGTLDAASALFAQRPSLPDDDFFAACVLGDLEAVARHLKRDPGLARATGGPLGWPAICYATFSRFLRDRRDSMQDAFARVVSTLLDRGADANAFWMSTGPWACRESALYGAAGIANSDAVTRALLDAGASPEEPDGETLYHVAEHADLRCLRLILPHVRPGPWLNYGMCHQMDHEDPAGLALFLEAGGDVNCRIDRGQPVGWRPLHFAVDRGRSTRILTMLLDAGADPSMLSDSGETAMRFALMRGRAEVIELFESRGFVADFSERDRWLLSLMRGDYTESDRRRPARLDLSPREREMLPHAAMNGRIDAVNLMLDAGWPIDTRGRWGGSALHQALVAGQVEVARLLIERGADLLIRNDYGGDALGCAIFAFRNGAPAVEPLFETIARRIPRETLEAVIRYQDENSGADRAIAEKLRRIAKSEAK